MRYSRLRMSAFFGLVGGADRRVRLACFSDFAENDGWGFLGGKVKPAGGAD